MLSVGLFLSGLDPRFAGPVRWLQERCYYAGAEARIVSGRRSWSEQQALWLKNRTPYEVAHPSKLRGAHGTVTDARPGESPHNYGMAIDLEGTHWREIVAFARSAGFGTIDWDPGHLEHPYWRMLVA
jgi:D-alanyl-D-alanine carboxypeptidase-like protein